MHVVVVGSGIAGLTAAIRASTAHDVTLVTKGALADGATAYAQGGIAVALGADDTSALHQADTHVAAAGSADARAVEVLCTDGPARVRDLLALGVPFDRSSDPATLDRYGDDLARGREAAHGRWRVLHADGDATGDAVAAAWRAGAVVADLEFVQFHPTRLAVPGGGLVSEAVRGEGAVLRDASGHRFMTDVHPDAELAPRDVVARGIAAAVRDQGGAPVLLDATALGADFLTGRFPGLTRATRAAGFDWTRQGVPVSPAAHYAMGGIATDAEGRTSLPGLLAVGEAACTGVHGANRLASNSLLEGLVFAVRAADAVAGPRPGLLRLRGDAGLQVTTVPRAADAGRAAPHLLGRHAPPQAPQRAGTGRSGPGPDRSGGPDHRDGTADLRQAVQSVMTDRVGLLRDAAGLASARRDLDALTAATGGGVREHEDRALLDLARLVARAAETRTESRGAHARTDHPDTDPTAPASYAWVAEAAPVPVAVQQEVPA